MPTQIRTAPRPASSGSRTRARARARRARRARRQSLSLGIAALVCLAVLAAAVALQQRTAEDPGRGVAVPSPSTADADARDDAARDGDGSPDDGSPPAGKDRGGDAAGIPETGPGTFTVAPGGGPRSGDGGELMRYQVTVEDGIDLSADEVAREVEGILGHERGWTARGQWSFQRVDGGEPDFVVRLATPGTVDEICGRYGLDTGGEVNCRVGGEVVVNLKRWMLATEFYTDDVPGYRALIINHEVGHFLGRGHESCPGRGRPAPVMMQQIKGLKGCVPNVWPYDEDGRPITGPATP
ncbi:hypothetical protein GCM10027168_14500 [Streptomyces capparidis]